MGTYTYYYDDPLQQISEQIHKITFKSLSKTPERGSYHYIQMFFTKKSHATLEYAQIINLNRLSPY